MELYWGDETLNLKLDSSKTVSQLPDANVPWTGKGFAEALEFPFNFPPLDQCATPDDRVVVALDPGTLALGFSFAILLERLQKAGIAAAQVTILLPSQTSDTCLAKILQEAVGCSVERHNPADAMARMILGGTRDGRQIYLNRRLVEADLAIVVSAVRLGGGNQSPASLIYPGMACDVLSGVEAGTVLNLLGAPYLITAVPGPNGKAPHWFAGRMEAFRAARDLHRSIWNLDLDEPVELVVLNWPKSSGPREFANLATALERFRPCLEPGGRFVIVCPEISDTDDWQAMASTYLDAVESSETSHSAGSFTKTFKRWSRALRQGSIFILSSLETDTCEDLQAHRLDRLSNIQRLASAATTILLIGDADRAMAKPAWQTLGDS